VGAFAQGAAALLWIPQAGLLAWAVQDLAEGSGARAVLMPAALIALLGVMRALIEGWGARRVFDQSRDFLTRLRRATVEALARRSPLDRDRPASGLAASALAEQAEAVVPWLSRYRGARWRVMLVPPLIALAVLSQSWVAALILIVAMPLIPLFMALIGWRAKAASEAQMVELGQMNAFLLDRLRGLSTIRSLDAVDATARRLRTSAESLRERSMRVLRIAFLSSAALELFSALAVAFVAVYVGFHLLGTFHVGTWSGRLSLGEGLFILMLAPAFFEPLRDLAAVWHDQAAGQAALALLERHREAGSPLPGALDDGVDEANEPATPGRFDGADAPVVPRADARIGSIGPVGPIAVSLRGLRFAHAGESPLFGDHGVDLDVHVGERVALTGASGEGKSTLLALIAGLATPTSGTVRFGGPTRIDADLNADADAVADASASPRAGAGAGAGAGVDSGSAADTDGEAGGLSVPTARGRIAWIGQHPHVFAGSVLRNVTLDRPGATRADASDAITFAELDDVLNASLDSPLGERGAGLSGGEQVRLALARAAIAHDAGLVLADEPTAHLDPDTAERVTDALLRLARGRTLIVATHDTALIERLDRVITLAADADADVLFSPLDASVRSAA
jgi:ATP-binding cassette subfamily C protein CydD